jgi:cytochrome c oxidase assembly factor CtaG
MEFWLFQAGVALAWLAMFGPLDEWAEDNAAWHMTQHMLLMLAIAPLWALARPLPQWRALFGAPIGRLWRLPLRTVRRPLFAALLHGALIWLWHAPRPYRLALEQPWWHLVEHACFLFSAWLFWWAVLRAAPRRQGEALLALLFTSMHTGLLGALLTFARLPLYRDTGSFGDQQLAGLLMWVPGGVIYLGAACWCGQRWLRRLWLRRGSRDDGRCVRREMAGCTRPTRH